VSGRSSDRESLKDKQRSLSLSLPPFTWEALTMECERLGVSEEEFVRYAVLYYVADLDSGRTSRRLPQRRSPEEPTRRQR
jgi:hypothetical protein